VKKKPAAHDGEQEIAAAHRRRQEPLEQLADAHIDDNKPHAPQPASHQPHPNHSRQQEVDIARAGRLQVLHFRRWLSVGRPEQRRLDRISRQPAFGPMWLVPELVGRRSARPNGDYEVRLARLQALSPVLARAKVEFESRVSDQSVQSV
jgi:hypothetical protein